ncbi:MAG: arginase family protein [Streptosporangiaceae bacterium]
MTNAWTLIGVPTSAGAHHAGQDRAPAALRAAGLADRLRAAGVSLRDAGDLPGAVFAVDHAHPDARNLAAVVTVASEVAAAVAALVRAGQRPLVVGGDCTITVGVVAGVQRVHPDAGLAYVDADADLGSGMSLDSSGILDATGIWHLLGHGEPELAGLAGEPPLLDGPRLAMVGLDPRELTDAGRRFLTEIGVRYIEGPQFMADPRAAAQQALTALRAASSTTVVHFDVDVVDSGDLPLGNYPHYNSGVLLDAVTSALGVLLADPSCAALVLTEVNPSYDPGGGQLDRYIDAVVAGVTAVTGG